MNVCHAEQQAMHFRIDSSLIVKWTLLSAILLWAETKKATLTMTFFTVPAVKFHKTGLTDMEINMNYNVSNLLTFKAETYFFGIFRTS